MKLQGLLFRVLTYGLLGGYMVSGAWVTLAQNIKATITGKVLDAQGQRMAGAQITIYDVARGSKRALVSNAQGLFNQPGLEPGAYRVEAAQSGFAPYESDLLELQVGDVLSLDISLQAAGVATTVEVVGQPTALQTDNASQSKNFGREEMNDLPVQAGGTGRNFYAQALTTPGVAVSTLAHRPFAVSGQRPRNNNYLIDAAETNDATTGFIAGRAETEQLISQEAVQSFQIITHNAKAEYGRNSGAIVNLVSKGGTNELHGSVYEYHNNSALSARNFFETHKASRRSNLGGFTVGGPVKRDKAYFFGNYEFFRSRGSDIHTFQTLTDDERARAVSAVRPLVALYPASPTSARLVTLGTPTIGNQNTYLIRGDLALTDRQTLMMRTNYTDSVRDNNAIGNTVSSHVQIHNQTRGAVIHHSYTPRPTVLNELRLNYTRQTEEDAFLDPVTLGDPRVNGEIGFMIVPGLSLAGPLGFLGRHNFQNTFRVSDEVSWTRGRHVLKFGSSVTRLHINGGAINNGFVGAMFFPNIDAFLAGQPLSFNRNTGNPIIGLRRTEWHSYVQDDWKITPHWTLNLGLRYELNTAPTEVAGRIAEPFRFKADPRDFTPRVGFAWSGLLKTVVRGGYGIFYNAIEMGFLGLTRYNPPLLVNVSAFRPTLPNQVAQARAGIPSGLVIPDPNVRTPYAQHLTWSIERELWNPQSTLTASYVGTLGTRLSRTRRPNGGDNIPQAQRPDPTRGIVNRLETSGASNYHALQVSLSQRFTSGLQFRASYTFSKFIDDVSEFIQTNQNPDRNVIPLDENNLRRDRAVSDFHIPHIFSLSYLYRLPFFQQSRWLGGWTLSGITTMQSGRPYSLYSGTDNLSGTNNNRINDVAGALTRDGSSAQPIRVTTPDAIKPAPGTLGTLGRNTERMDNLMTWNISLAKDFRVTETKKFEVRGELFNLFNKTSFSDVDAVLSSPTFGRALAAFDPRRMQVAARFVF